MAKQNENSLTKTEEDCYQELCAIKKSFDDFTCVEGFSWETPGNQEKFVQYRREKDALEKKVIELFINPETGGIYAWYDRLAFQTRMKALYPKCICSACPFSQGVEILLKEKRVPCSMFYKQLRINPLYECGHVNDKRMTMQQLCHLIVSKGQADNNEDCLYFFLKKRKELKPYTYPKNISEIILENLKEFI